MHFSNVCTVVTRIRKVFDPTPGPIVGILQNSGGMGVVTGKEACPGRSAGGRGNMALREADAFFDQPVQMGRDAVRVT